MSALGGAAGPVTTASADGGVARLTADLRSMPPGLVTVHVRAVTTRGPVADAYVQLLRGDAREADVPSSAASRGRSLVYAEEFDRPISISRDGAGAAYAASKPEAGGPAEFGDAIFADPALGFDNVAVVDDHYLRLQVSPKPSSKPDPLGWNRSSIGGILASARPGGSGFSSQYGYFEARMLAPAAIGTWPAFWMLPAPGLVPNQQTLSEIDAVELYGHDPVSACHSTHGYGTGKDTGIARCGRRFPSVQSALQWHTYDVSIEPTRVAYFIDGKQVATAPQVRGGGEPMFFLVDLALGGGWPVDLAAVSGTSALYVDSVRVYQ